MYTLIIFQENELDAINKLEKHGLDLSDKFKSDFSNLFNRTSNNYVGYYLWKQQNSVYKILVLPKTIDKNDPKAEQKLVEYLFNYYYLSERYGFDISKKIAGSVINLVHKSYKETHLTHIPIEIFEYYRQISTVIAIQDFFKKFKGYKKQNQDYISQSIRYKLNLLKNIHELDKSKIHQSKNSDISYAKIATITYYAIKLFEIKRVMLLPKPNQKEILRVTNKLKQYLLKKFDIERSLKINEKTLCSSKIFKIFKSRAKHVELYFNILTLFGFENLHKDSQEISVNTNQNIRKTALFIDPIKLYEWYLYHRLKIVHTKDLKEKKLTILNGNISLIRDNKKTTETQTKYDITFNKETTQIKSNPDIIINVQSKKIFIIDAKWKILNNKIPDLGDILKLKRDCEVRNRGYDVYAILVYPSANKSFSQEFLYKDEDYTFSFYIYSLSYNDVNVFNIFDIKDKALPLRSNPIDTAITNFVESKGTMLSTLNQYDIDESNKQSIILDQLTNNVQIIHKEITKQYSLKEILEDEYCQAIKLFLNQYKEDLEPECIKFIHSSASSMFYFNQHKKQIYDYSLPASGVWKSIEVELNASILFLIRISQNICTVESFTKPKTDHPKGYILTGSKERNRKVYTDNLNYKTKQLNNITLGQFPHIIKNIFCEDALDNGEIKKIFTPIYDKHYNSQFKSIELWADNISEFLFDIVQIRNPYTHKDSMHNVTYELSLDYILNNSRFNFGDFIQLKQHIVAHIKETHKSL